MQPGLYEQAGKLFHRAVELPPDQRDSFLDESCDGNPLLRAAVNRLLDHDLTEDSDDIFGTPLHVMDRHNDSQANAIDEQVSTVLPKQFGRYRVIRSINRGGMGVVFEAEQDQPRQRVALKVIASHKSSKQVMERFRREAAILGRLRHPGIAQVFDAGEAETEDGPRPYIAMELIDGDSLIKSAEANQLDDKQRLSLLADICDAVQHAHECGIVHRDLKPENVMVTSRGDIKVLDFGIAFVRSDQIDPMSKVTTHGQIVGTLNYMSPEQLMHRDTEVDARADIYSIGVLMYEMLAGKQPHDLRNCSLHEAIRRLSEDDPVPLSEVNPKLDRDLTTIVAKAMEREVGRRYATAADLGADILRYIRDEPITARPVSAAYRVRKMARRNRAMFTGVTLAVLALMVGTAVAGMQAVSAKRSQVNAELAAISSQAISDFLIKEILMANTPDVAQGNQLSLRDAFLRAASRLPMLDDQPDIQADIHHLLGEAFLNIGDAASAKSHFESALAIRSERDGPSDRDAIRSLLGVCSAGKRLPPIDANEQLQWRAYQLSLDAYGIDDQLTQQALSNVASFYLKAKRYEDAAEIFRDLLDIVDQDEHEDQMFRYELRHNLADTLSTLKDYDKAAIYINEAVEGKVRLLGSMHPSTILSELVAAILEYRRENFADARDRLRDIVTRATTVHGKSHRVTCTASEVLARSIVRTGIDIVEAEPFIRSALAARLDPQNKNPEPVHIASDYSLLGAVLTAKGKRTEAIVALEEARRRYHALDPDHPKLSLVQERINEALELAE